MKKRTRNQSISIPREDRFGENMNWEDGLQCYELDNEIQDEEYFTNMNPEDLIKLLRKMDNFILERGISEFLIHNYNKANKVFNDLFDKD